MEVATDLTDNLVWQRFQNRGQSRLLQTSRHFKERSDPCFALSAQGQLVPRQTRQTIWEIVPDTFFPCFDCLHLIASVPFALSIVRLDKELPEFRFLQS